VPVTYRQITAEDRPMIAEWLAEDKLHLELGITIDDLFALGCIPILVSDEHGPLIAIRVWKALRFGMQFKPKSRIRIAKVGAEVVAGLQKMASNLDCTEVICRPGGAAVNFASALGFNEFEGQMIRVNNENL
jgi:hypothetical protein